MKQLAVLVVGGDGLCGKALVRHLGRLGHHVVTTTRRPVPPSDVCRFLDLAAPPSSWILPADIDVAFICAAVTGIEVCEQDPAGTASVNVTATTKLCRRLAEVGTFTVVVSTNMVFDGSCPFRRPDEAPSPMTAYGRQKAELEKSISELGDVVSIVRMTKVLQPDHPLLSGWIAELSANRPVRPYEGMSMAPVTLNLAVEALTHAGLRRQPGTIHVSGDSDLRYVDVAHYIADRLNVSTSFVCPVLPADLPRLATMPRWTTLDATTMCERLGLQPPSSWDAVNAVLVRSTGVVRRGMGSGVNNGKECLDD